LPIPAYFRLREQLYRPVGFLRAKGLPTQTLLVPPRRAKTLKSNALIFLLRSKSCQNISLRLAEIALEAFSFRPI
jgi:hypothetical protein